MVKRLSNPLRGNSFFLFGARGVGKSTLLKHLFPQGEVFWINLLNLETLDRYSLDPQELYSEIIAYQKSTHKDIWVVIDEIQKCPKLLNIVHQVVEELPRVKFALTGSSARRLKQKGVNMLAGRAYVESLSPFTYKELEVESQFDLNRSLRWGDLPKTLSLESDEELVTYLRSYALTYIHHEIQEEQWVRKLDPFRAFLPIAAQMNAKPLNYSKISRDVGVDSTTIKSYYNILEDTLLGFHLRPFHESVRKQQNKSPKFYFFDTGVKRSLEKKLTLSLEERTYEYGEVFEHWIILQFIRLELYLKKDYEFFYLNTKDGLEVDLIVTRPGNKSLFIEIKSTKKIKKEHYQNLKKIQKTYKENAEYYLISQDEVPKVLDNNIEALHWKDALDRIFKLD